MSRLFDNATSDYLAVSSSNVTEEPLTLSGWFYPDEDALNFQSILSIGDLATATDYFALQVMTDVINDPLRAYVRSAAEGNRNASINGINLNAWNHGAGVYHSNISRYVWLNGVESAENTTEVNPTAANLTRIGALAKSGVVANLFSGYIAEAGIWNVGLTDAEVTILALGYSPLFVRPQNLIFYCPLIRDNDKDLVGGLSLSVGGTPTIGAHPRVRYPGNPYISHIITGAPPAGNVPMGALYGCLGGCLGRVG